MNSFRLANRLSSRVFGRLNSHGFIGSNGIRSLASSTPAPIAEQKLHELGTVDHNFEEYRINRVAEPERRAFTYLVASGVQFAYASTARFLVSRVLAMLSPSAVVLALAFAEFDVSNLEYGKSILVDWRGKPIYIRKRTQKEIDEVRSVPMEHLRDQETDQERTVKPEYVLVVAICPHLGCVPLADQGAFNGFFCPCHGSHYDVSGRIRLGPAPLNLDVPPYSFIEENVIQIG